MAATTRDVEAARTPPPTRRTSLLLERAQELGLEVERQLADLVEEERAAVGLFEQALVRFAAPVNAPRT